MSSSEGVNLPASRRRPPRRIRLTSLGCFILEVLGSLMVLVLINFFALWYLDRYSTNFGYWTLHQKWNLLAEMDAPVDWLILGDSSCSQGVLPAIILEQLGESAANLCTIGNVTALSDLWMLEEYIRRFGPPKGVLIIHVYDVWSRDLDPVLLGQIPRPWAFWNKHTLGDALVSTEEIRRELFLERYVPLVSQRLTLISILKSAFFGELIPFKPLWSMQSDGFVIADQAKPETAEQDGRDHLDFIRENAPSVSSINQEAVKKLVEIAELYQMPLYLVNSPIIESLAAEKDFQAHLGQLQAQLVAIIEPSEYTRLIAEVKTFPSSQLQTADHLILPGAQEYTHWLIQSVLSR
jgi:hypothetical protein